MLIHLVHHDLFDKVQDVHGNLYLLSTHMIHDRNQDKMVRRFFALFDVDETVRFRGIEVIDRRIKYLENVFCIYRTDYLEI